MKCFIFKNFKKISIFNYINISTTATLCTLVFFYASISCNKNRTAISDIQIDYPEKDDRDFKPELSFKNPIAQHLSIKIANLLIEYDDPHSTELILGICGKSMDSKIIRIIKIEPHTDKPIKDLLMTFRFLLDKNNHIIMLLTGEDSSGVGDWFDADDFFVDKNFNTMYRQHFNLDNTNATNGPHKQWVTTVYSKNHNIVEITSKMVDEEGHPWKQNIGEKFEYQNTEYINIVTFLTKYGLINKLQTYGIKI